MCFRRCSTAKLRNNHGVIACEGSMFKSKFANALTTMMIGSLGLASAENKLSVGYGGEAGHMDPLIRNMCAQLCVGVAGHHAQHGIAESAAARWVFRRNWEPIPRGLSSRIRRNMRKKFCAKRDGTEKLRSW